MRISSYNWTAHVTALLEVKKNKLLMFTGAACDSFRYCIDCELPTCLSSCRDVLSGRRVPTGKGGIGLMRSIVQHYDRAWSPVDTDSAGILEKLAIEFFGPGWKVCTETLSKQYRCQKQNVSKAQERDANAWLQKLNEYGAYGPWSRSTAYFDTTEIQAATIIQAVYRGWRARMLYRYNPHCSLGRFLVLRSMPGSIS